MSPPHDAPSRRAFWICFALCAVAAMVPLWTVSYLPMVDLPQHAAQVAIWQAYHDPGLGYEKLYEFNWFTPYLLGYSLTRLIALAFGVSLAIKVVISLAVLGLPLSCLYLLRSSSGEEWWALLTFPLAYGFCFYWGFLNYLIAIPLGVMLLGAAYRYRQAQTWGRGLALALWAVLLFFAHVLVLGLCGLAALILLADPEPGSPLRWRETVRRILPLLAAAPLMALWVLRALGSESQVHLGTTWGPLWRRLVEGPGLLLGSPNDALAALVLLAGLAALLICGVRWGGWRRAAPPAAAALVCYLAFPVFGFGVAMLYQRFAVFVAASILLALTLPQAISRRRAAITLIVALSVGWLGLVTARHLAFDRLARQIDPLIETMQPGKSLRMLVFDLRCPGIPQAFPVFMHHPVWYQVRKGGFVSFSFAQHYPELLRYRKNPSAAVPLGQETSPERFVWARDRHLYDYFIVRSRGEGWKRLFRGAGKELRMAGHQGEWWLLERVPR